MRFDKDALQWLADEIEDEGASSLIVTADDDALRLLGAQIPEAWVSALGAEEPGPAVRRLLWAGLEDKLPGTLGLLSSKLQSLAVLTTEAAPPSLLYLFCEEDEPYVYRGRVPLAQLPPIAAEIPVDLGAFYSVHDGWCSLDSQDAGLLPAAWWQSFAGGDGSSPFLAVWANGAMRMGLGRAADEWAAFALWPGDDEVETLDDFWAAVDDLYVAQLEDLDDAE